VSLLVHRYVPLLILSGEREGKRDGQAERERAREREEEEKSHENAQPPIFVPHLTRPPPRAPTAALPSLVFDVAAESISSIQATIPELAVCHAHPLRSPLPSSSIFQILVCSTFAHLLLRDADV